MDIFSDRSRYSNSNSQKEEGCYRRADTKATEWYRNNKLHRAGGPAIEYEGGSKRWFLDGIELSEEFFNKVTKGPVEDLPLYLGQGVDEYIAKRLKS